MQVSKRMKEAKFQPKILSENWDLRRLRCLEEFGSLVNLLLFLNFGSSGGRHLGRHRNGLQIEEAGRRTELGRRLSFLGQHAEDFTHGLVVLFVSVLVRVGPLIIFTARRLRVVQLLFNQTELGCVRLQHGGDRR